MGRKPKITSKSTPLPLTPEQNIAYKYFLICFSNLLNLLVNHISHDDLVTGFTAFTKYKLDRAQFRKPDFYLNQSNRRNVEIINCANGIKYCVVFYKLAREKSKETEMSDDTKYKLWFFHIYDITAQTAYAYDEGDFLFSFLWCEKGKFTDSRAGIPEKKATSNMDIKEEEVEVMDESCNYKTIKDLEFLRPFMNEGEANDIFGPFMNDGVANNIFG